MEPGWLYIQPLTSPCHRRVRALHPATVVSGKACTVTRSTIGVSRTPSIPESSALPPTQAKQRQSVWVPDSPLGGELSGSLAGPLLLPWPAVTALLAVWLQACLGFGDQLLGGPRAGEVLHSPHIHPAVLATELGSWGLCHPNTDTCLLPLQG